MPQRNFTQCDKYVTDVDVLILRCQLISRRSDRWSSTYTSYRGRSVTRRSYPLTTSLIVLSKTLERPVVCQITVHLGDWKLLPAAYWISLFTRQMRSYRRETALQGALVLAKVEDWNWETIFYGHYRSIFNHCDIIGLQIYRIRWKKCKIRAVMPFKVIQGHRGRYQSKARMRLPISD